MSSQEQEIDKELDLEQDDDEQEEQDKISKKRLNKKYEYFSITFKAYH